MKLLRLLILLAVAGVLVAACARQPASSTQSAVTCRQSGPDAPAYRIGTGDVLQISVWNKKDLDRTVTVRPDGMISFPLLDDIRAAGLTPMQLQNYITSGLKKYITDAEASVVVQEVNSFTVSVLGEVQKPGRYEMQSGRATVLDALAMAGGLTPYANRSDIHVMRESGGKTQQIPFHYGRAVSMHPEGADFCVNPGDIVVVP